MGFCNHFTEVKPGANECNIANNSQHSLRVFSPVCSAGHMDCQSVLLIQIKSHENLEYPLGERSREVTNSTAYM